VLAVAAAVVALLALRAIMPRLLPTASAPRVSSDTTGHPVGGPDRPVDGRLLLGTDDGLFRADLATGAVRALTVGGTSAWRAADRRLVGHHRTVVVIRDGVAYALSSTLDRPAVRLGRASFAVASKRADRVWLVEQAPDPDRWFTVREVGLDGTPISPAATLPLGRTPRAGVAGGLLISTIGEPAGLVIWEPATGRTRPLAPGDASFVAARGGLVAWSAGGRLHLTELPSGRDRVIVGPPGMAGFDAVGEFSPDGGTLAALTVPQTSGASAVALVDVRRASVRQVEGSAGALSGGCDPCLSWSPAGHDLIFARVGPSFGVGGYRLGARRATVLPLQVPGVSPPSVLAL
jgi:hypothetical protein